MTGAIAAVETPMWQVLVAVTGVVWIPALLFALATVLHTTVLPTAIHALQWLAMLAADHRPRRRVA